MLAANRPPMANTSGRQFGGKLKELFDAVDFDSSPVVIPSAEQAKHVGDEENQQYCPQPNAGPAARTPAGWP